MAGRRHADKPAGGDTGAGASVGRKGRIGGGAQQQRDR